MAGVWPLRPVWYYIQERVGVDRKRLKNGKKVSRTLFWITDDTIVVGSSIEKSFCSTFKAMILISFL